MTSVTFSETQTSHSVVIVTHDDDMLEKAESFSLALSDSEGESVLILPSQSTVWIMDNDEGVFNLVHYTTGG